VFGQKSVHHVQKSVNNHRRHEYKYDYGLAGASGGATAHNTSLVSVLAIVCCIVVLLEVVDCTGYMAAGGTKDGTFVAHEMCT
jgi:hypothetical protein